MVPAGMFWNERAQIVGLTAKHRFAGHPCEREYTDYGGLISYGPDISNNFRRAAGYVDKILKGANPGDLPIQQPAKLELVVNLKTAKELGLTIPSALFVRADEVIE